MVFGPVSVKTINGEEHRESAKTAFCKCGHSTNKPFCDGSHRKVEFVG
jgi:CDGSH-type Zn-finger protein